MLQGTTTRLPAVAAAIVAEVGTLFPTATILNGPRAGQALADKIIEVGIGGSDHDAYDVQRSVEGWANRPTEVITINCYWSLWTGDQDGGIATILSAWGADHGALDTWLRGNPTLGGVCDRAYLGDQESLNLLQVESGAAVLAEFRIHAEALL